MSTDPSAAPLLLLVEDDPDDVDLAKLALVRSRIETRVVVASDGREALDYLLGRGASVGSGVGETPVVVLLDLKLPRLSGKEVLREIRANEGTRRIPVVVLSSSDETRDIAECYALGANSYFKKPVDFGEFTEGVSVLLHYWLVVNAPAQAAYGARAAGVPLPPPPFSPLRRTLPLEATGESLAHVGSGARAPVVVVDPDPVDRARTVQALADLVGDQPIGGGTSCEEAVQFLLQEGVCKGADPWRCPQLVILAIGPDHELGLDAIRAIRAAVDRRLVVAAFSAETAPALVLDAYGVLASSFVYKPPDPEDYRSVVRMMGFYWLHLNVAPPARIVPTLFP